MKRNFIVWKVWVNILIIKILLSKTLIHQILGLTYLNIAKSDSSFKNSTYAHSPKLWFTNRNVMLLHSIQCVSCCLICFILTINIDMKIKQTFSTTWCWCKIVKFLFTPTRLLQNLQYDSDYAIYSKYIDITYIRMKSSAKNCII